MPYSASRSFGLVGGWAEVVTDIGYLVFWKDAALINIRMNCILVVITQDFEVP
jgi:hypothetical protein